MVIPNSLKTEALKLEHFAFKYRQRSKEESGGDKDKEARTQIRLDTLREGLLLGIREQRDKDWVFFKPSELPEVDSSEDEDDTDESTDEEDGGEEEEEEEEVTQK